jgi:DNA-directed RNA polymerase subunit RPC12/RpoP
MTAERVQEILSLPAIANPWRGVRCQHCGSRFTVPADIQAASRMGCPDCGAFPGYVEPER